MKTERLSIFSGIEGLIAFFIIGCSIILLATPWYGFAAVPAVALLALLAVARYSSVFYYVIIALIPFAAFRRLPGSLQGVQIHYLLALLLCFCLAFQALRRQDLLQRLKCNLWPWMIAFLFAGAVSALGSPYPDTAYSDLLRQLMAFGFIALTLAYVDERGFFKTLPALIGWSVSIGSLLAVLGYFLDFQLFVADAAGSEGRRAVGGTTWANTLARTIYVAMPFLIYSAIHARTRIRKIVACLCILVNLLAMGTTLSRLGFLMLLFVGIGVVLEYHRRVQVRRVAPLYVLLVVVLGTAIFALPAVYWERLGRLVSGDADQSVSRRVSYLDVATDAFQSKPILGWGPGTFRDIYGQTTYAAAFAKNSDDLRRYAHNSYVEVAVGTGIIGLVPFLILLALTIGNYSRARRVAANSGDWEQCKLIAMYRLSFLCMIISFLFGSGLDNKYYLLLLPLSQIALRVAQRPQYDAAEERMEATTGTSLGISA